MDITEKFIKDRLDPALVTELVIRCIPNIPSSIPPQFSNSYTPIGKVQYLPKSHEKKFVKLCVHSRYIVQQNTFHFDEIFCK